MNVQQDSSKTHCIDISVFQCIILLLFTIMWQTTSDDAFMYLNHSNIIHLNPALVNYIYFHSIYSWFSVMISLSLAKYATILLWVKWEFVNEFFNLKWWLPRHLSDSICLICTFNFVSPSVNGNVWAFK